MALCRQHELSYSTFAAWLQRRRKEQASGDTDIASKRPPFAEVIVDEEKPDAKPVPLLRAVPRLGVSFKIASPEQSPLTVGLIQTRADSRSR